MLSIECQCSRYLCLYAPPGKLRFQKYNYDIPVRTIQTVSIGGSRGRVAGVATPPLVGKFYQKRSFLVIFRAATPPPFLDRMVDKSNRERLQPPLSKISRSAYGQCTILTLSLCTSLSCSQEICKICSLSCPFIEKVYLFGSECSFTF